jgi:CRP/FNR family transcriptional activator FtrB
MFRQRGPPRPVPTFFPAPPFEGLTEVKVGGGIRAETAIMMSPSVGDPEGSDAALAPAEPESSLGRAARQCFLGGLAPARLTAVLQGAELRFEEPRALLFRAGEMPQALVLVQSGSDALFGLAAGRREVTLDIVQTPDTVAPWAPLSGTPYAVSARVIRRAGLLCLSAERLREELRRDAGLAELMLRQICRCGCALMAQIEDLKLRTTTERVGGYLLALGAGDRQPLELPFSKQLIASQLGMTPESLSRAFATLRDQGVAIDGSRVTIVDAARIRRFCHLDR